MNDALEGKSEKRKSQRRIEKTIRTRGRSKKGMKQRGKMGGSARAHTATVPCVTHLSEKKKQARLAAVLSTRSAPERRL